MIFNTELCLKRGLHTKTKGWWGKKLSVICLDLDQMEDVLESMCSQFLLLKIKSKFIRDKTLLNSFMWNLLKLNKT